MASKQFLKAANLIVGDRSAVNALVFLSQSALFKAELANNMMIAAALASPESQNILKDIIVPAVSTINNGTTITRNDVIDDQIGKASSSGRILLLSNSTHERNTGSSSKMRTSGLMSVPKAGCVLPSDAAYDLFFLEKKLGELGLMSGSSSAINKNNSALTSALGESFMLLSTTSSRKGGRNQFPNNSTTIPFGTSDTTRSSRQEVARTGPVNVLTDNSSGANSTKKTEKPSLTARESSPPIPVTSTFSGAYGGTKKITGTTPLPIPQKVPVPGNKNGNFWLPNAIEMLAWGGLKASPSSTSTSTSSTIVPSSSTSVPSESVRGGGVNVRDKDTVYDSNQFDLNWNDDQSVFNILSNQIHTDNKKNDTKNNNNNNNNNKNNSNNKNNNNNHDNNNNNNNDNNDFDKEDSSQGLSAAAIQGYFITPQEIILSPNKNDENNDDNQNDGNNSNSNSNINSNSNNSSSGNNNNTNNTMRESELRLLQSIKRLGDENYSLLHRIELLSSVEARNLELHSEMVSFKKEFQERFSRLKEVLREFQRKNSMDGNMRTFGFEFNTVIGGNSGGEGRTDKNNGSDKNGKLDSSGIKIGSKENGSSQNGSQIQNQNQGTEEPENVRQQQLERTVLALVKRLEEVSTRRTFFKLSNSSGLNQ